jgi:hypothetical protein
MMHEGSRGLDDIENFNEYGVDWEDYDNAAFMRQLCDANPDDTADAAVFAAPEHINTVICEPPNSPLSQDEIRELDGELSRRLGAAATSRDMTARRAVWEAALSIVTAIVSG